MIQELIEEFQRLHSTKPDWAWDSPPSIPLIGQNYKVGQSLFVYASAENLVWRNKPEKLRFQFEEPKVWNRYREVYEAEGRHLTTHFPEVGIAPVSNGPLLCAAHYVAEACNLPTAEGPREFLEHITVSNFCKFSIKSPENIDYIEDLDKVRESLPFVMAELSALRPGVILLPENVWKYREPADAIRRASPDSRIVACKQFNARVVNTHLGDFHEQGLGLREEYLNRHLHTWMTECKGLKRENSWRFIAHLRHVTGSYDAEHVQREAARSLARLGGTEPQIKPIPRRRSKKMPE